MRAYIVVDLGFGDSGKGLLTDFLVRHFEAGVVVRYNGGAQAGLDGSQGPPKYFTTHFLSSGPGRSSHTSRPIFRSML